MRGRECVAVCGVVQLLSCNIWALNMHRHSDTLHHVELRRAQLLRSNTCTCTCMCMCMYMLCRPQSARRCELTAIALVLTEDGSVQHCVFHLRTVRLRFTCNAPL